MNLWDQYDEFFSGFSVERYDFPLYAILHRLKALFLYPLNCGCEKDCECEDLRVKVILSLSLDLYNKAEEQQENPDTLHGIKFFFKIPDDHKLRRNYGQCYPLWLIQQEWQAKETSFRIVARLIETLLRLGQTYKASILREPRTSVNEALDLILGKMPLKSKVRKGDKELYLCGEKAYGTYFNTYKSICHFVMAYQLVFKEYAPLPPHDKIKEFLSFSKKIRQELLYLKTPNIKGKCLFSEETLLPLPSWVAIKDIELPLDPFKDKLREINGQVSGMKD